MLTSMYKLGSIGVQFHTQLKNDFDIGSKNFGCYIFIQIFYTLLSHFPHEIEHKYLNVS